MTTLDEALLLGRGVERPFNCPVHEDVNASASVNADLGLWVCYACGAGGKVDGHVPDPAVTVKALTELDEPIRIYAEAWLDLFDAHYPEMDWADWPVDYWGVRYDVDTARHFRCGQDPLTNQPTYPIRDLSGRVLGVVRRDENEDPKYKYPWGVRTSRTFFSSRNHLDRCRVAVLVEGAADVMALHHAGLPNGWQALGCYGSGLHAPQTAALLESNPKLVIVAFDDDKAGRLATERAVSVLSDAVRTVTHRWSANDPGAVAQAERIPQLLATLTHHNLERFAA